MRWLASGLLAVLLALPVASAQPVPLTFSSLGVRDGLSGYVITALARQGQDFLWIGTQRGLCRYDGARVRVFSRATVGVEALPDDDIRAIALDARSGHVWAGTRTGRLVRLDPATETVETVAHVRWSGNLAALHVDGGGRVWIGAETLLRFDPATGRVDEALPAPVHALAPSPDGSLWAAQVGQLVRIETAASAAASSITIGSGEVVQALVWQGRTAWIGTRQGHLYRWTPGEAPERMARPAAGGAIRTLAPSNRYPHLLWIGTDGQGLEAFDTRTGGRFSYREGPVPGALTHPDVHALLEDAEGVLWVGTGFELNRAQVARPRFDAHFVVAGGDTLRGAVWGLHAPRRDVAYVTLARQGLFRYSRDTRRSEPVAGAEDLTLAISVHEATGGTLWVAGVYAALYALDEEGQRSTYPLPAPTQLVHSITAWPARPHLLLVATREAGLVVFDTVARAVVARYHTISDRPLASNYVWSVTPSPHDPDVVLVAMRYGGVARLNLSTGESVAYRARQSGAEAGCLPTDDAIVATESQDGSMWIGTYGGGLTQILPDGQTCRTLEASLLPFSDVSAIYEDGQGRLWLATSGGLALYDPAAEAVTHFDERDGLLSSVFHYDARDRSPTGELLLGGPAGFHIFHPDTVRVDTLRPDVALMSVAVDGTPVGRDRWQEGRLTVAHHQSDVVLGFAARSLRDPDRTRYRARIAGLNTGWLELGRQGEVRFPFLPPGRHQIELMAAGPGGYWSRTPAVLALTVRPPFWAAWWFWLAASLSIGAVVAAAYQYRLRQLRRIELTRRRIADDLHDDLGSKVSSVALRLELAACDSTLPAPPRQALHDLAAQTRSIVSDLRDAVWLVDTGRDALSELVERFESAGPGLVPGARFRLHVEALSQPQLLLPMEARRHLYLIFKEALHNAVAHGQAHAVTVRLAEAEGRFTLAIRDDGRGFVPDAAREGRGLSTMQRRAEALRGTLRVESIPGEGTTVHLVVPMLPHA